MWRHFLLLGVLLASPVIGWADAVNFTVPPSDFGTIFAGGSVDLFSSSLDGTVLSGQSLSLDVLLSDSVLAHIQAVDPNSFGVNLEIFTNAPAGPGFAGPTTGFLLDSNGNQFGSTLTAGRSDGSDGSFSMGLVLFTSADLEDEINFEISGAEFATELPSTGYAITGAELIFTLGNHNRMAFVDPGRNVPEPSTAMLTLVGLFAVLLAAFVKIRRNARDAAQ